MFSEPLNFIWAVIHFWAEWSTGGPLVLAVLLARLLKKGDFRRGIEWAFLIFFLFLGFFSAWESEKQQRISAEIARDTYKQDSAYKQKRIDKLSDERTNNPTGKYSGSNIGYLNSGGFSYLILILLSPILLNL
jgi:hypothetical protein